MSMDKGLKAKNALARHRNVLSRSERYDALQEVEKWDDKMSVFGLPKVANRKIVVKKEKAEVAEGDVEAGEAVEGAEGADAAATDTASSES
jgi:small basic protein (TIGR04137 family)